MQTGAPRVAVVGHVEWVTFARVGHVPRAGEVLHARDPFEEPAGGGAVAAVQLARLAGKSVLVTALGDDEHGRQTMMRLRELGVEVWAAQRPAPTRTAVTLVDDAGERTITTFGPRPEAVGDDQDVPWSSLGEMPVDSYGCGDSFAAGLTYGLGTGLALADALDLAARCGAVCLTGRGPYERQLTAAG